MTKSELIEAVQKALGENVTRRAAGEAVEAVLASITVGVRKDKKVQIAGFGTFEVSKRAARAGRNPKTGAIMKIGATFTVRFKASTSFKVKSGIDGTDSTGPKRKSDL